MKFMEIKQLKEENKVVWKLNKKLSNKNGEQRREIKRNKKTIAELNEENDNLVIEMAKLKNNHDKHVDEALSKIKELEKVVKNQQKAHDSFIKQEGGKELPKVEKFCIGKNLYNKFIKNDKRTFFIHDGFVRQDYLFLVETNLNIPTNRRALVAILKVYKQGGFRYMVVSDPINNF